MISHIQEWNQVCSGERVELKNEDHAKKTLRRRFDSCGERVWNFKMKITQQKVASPVLACVKFNL